MIAILAALFVMLSVWRGSAVAVTLTLAAPLALLVTQALSSAAFLGSVAQQFPTGTPQALLFLAVLIAVSILIHRITSSFSDGGGMLTSLVAGLAVTAVLIVVWIQVPALQSLWHFGPQVQAVFGAAYRFWWLLSALLALAFVRS
jgi:hypothetical protein